MFSGLKSVIILSNPANASISKTVPFCEKLTLTGKLPVKTTNLNWKSELHVAGYLKSPMVVDPPAGLLKAQICTVERFNRTELYSV